MLGLRFYTCDRCGAVHADLDGPPQCSRCHATSLSEITRRLQADSRSYFWRADERDRDP
jgi:rubredoxin